MSDRQSEFGDSAHSRHRPVMVREVLHYLAPEPGQVVVDGTVGGGGHAAQILEKIGEQGRLLGLDRDPMMLRLAATKLTAPNVSLEHASYADLMDVLDAEGIRTVDRILVDLGLSSDQLLDASRGFGFDTGGRLDLRFDTNSGSPAYEIVNSAEEAEVRRILAEYGDERFSAAIAAAVVQRRRTSTIHTAADLVEIVNVAVRGSVRHRARKHPATRVFQALRIAANRELEHLTRGMNDVFPRVLKPGGRVVAISFHSLESRIVKHSLRQNELWRNLTPKPIEPTPAEIRENPRSRSAKLRAGVRK